MSLIWLPSEKGQAINWQIWVMCWSSGLWHQSAKIMNLYCFAMFTLCDKILRGLSLYLVSCFIIFHST